LDVAAAVRKDVEKTAKQIQEKVIQVEAETRKLVVSETPSANGAESPLVAKETLEIKNLVEPEQASQENIPLDENAAKNL